MSRNRREAELKSLYGKRYGAVLVSELGGRKRDRRKMLTDEVMKQYQEGTVPAYARSLSIDAQRAGGAGMAHRKVMNALPTLAGLGVGLARGAEFGVGPDDSIVAQYDDPNYQVDPQTLGEVMLLPKGRTGSNVVTHELGHVEQGKYFGPLLPAAAAITSLVQGLRGKDPYLDSPFEQKALEMGKAAESRSQQRISPTAQRALLGL